VSVREIARSLAADLFPPFGYSEVTILKIEQALLRAQVEAMNEFGAKLQREIAGRA